jgi:septum formation protein
MRIILASGSPRRHYLLKMINLSHEVIPSSVKEIVPVGLSPEEVARSLALQKAQDVANSQTNSVVIGADTIVVLDGEILGKPESAAQAVEMLQKLSGNTHTVITGVAILVESHEKVDPTVFHESTQVTFSSLTDDEIRAYVAGGSPMDKAGAYGIQDDLGCLFVSKIQGDYYNVVGLPLQQLYQQLRSVNPEIAQRLFNASYT